LTGTGGTAGNRGVTGASGATGTGFSDYIYLSYLPSPATTVPNGSPVPFVTTWSSPSGYSNAGGIVTVPNTGYYLISLGVTQDSVAFQISIFTLYRNGVSLGGNYRISTQNIASYTYAGVTYKVIGLVSLTSLLQLSAGDTIQLVNESGVAVHLTPFAPYTSGPGAYMTITQIQ
jgi:hypothetical protein